MKLSILALAALILGGVCLFSCSKSDKHFQSVSVQEFEEVIKNPDVQILDSRTPEEYAEGHLLKAINIDVKDSSFEVNALNSLDRTKNVAVYCRSGRRSKMAAEMLYKNGFKVIELDGGIIDWMDKNKPIVR